MIGPFAIRKRSNPDTHRQRYILDANKQYVTGLAICTCPFFEEIINELFVRLNTKTITCKYEAVRLAKSMSDKSQAVLQPFP